jgi:hypothetical protein
MSGVTDFIASLVVHFPVRHENTAREAEWLAAMVKALRGYDGSTLSEAAAMMIESRKDRRFPLPAECKDACNEIIRRNRAAKPQLIAEKSIPEWSDHRQRLADELVMTPLGKRAAQENWLLSLWNFIRDNMRLPQEHEIPKCIAAARGFDEAYEMLHRQAQTGPVKAAIRLGDQMLARREKLRAMVLDGVV